MNNKKYKFKRAILFAVGFIPAIISLFFFKKKKNRIIFSSEINNNFTHSSKFLFLYFLKNYQEFDIKFVMISKTKRAKLTQKYGKHFISPFNLVDIFYILQAKTWITSSLATPIAGLFLSFNRNVIHLSHGSTVKSIGLNAKNLKLSKKIVYKLLGYNFSHFFCAAKIFDKSWQKFLNVPKDKIIRAPLARNSALEQTSQPPDFFFTKHSILYAPTWRPYENTSFFPFSDLDLNFLNSFLQQNDICIYLRSHPNFEQNLQYEFDDFSNIKLLSKKEIPDINEILNSFNMLITDYSSIYLDFLLLERPLIFLPYDFEQYKKEVGIYLDYKKFTPSVKPKNQQDFIKNLGEILLDKKDIFKNQRKKINNEVNFYKKNHLEICAKIILDLINKNKK